MAGWAEVSAEDVHSIRTLVFKNVGHFEVLHDGHFLWKITSYKDLPGKSFSPPFQVGDVTWRILFFPHGKAGSYHACLYLEAIPPPDVSSTWYVCAQIGFCMYSPATPTKHKINAVNHRFYEQELDWGFNNFSDTSASMTGEVNILAFVRIVKDPTGVLWHNFRNYDSWSQTGYVGLENQGATAYLNSILQSLYFTNAFRKMVYEIPVDDSHSDSSFIGTLQEVFGELQTCQHAVSTRALTNSFGWSVSESFVAQDAWEFQQVFLEGLEHNMKTKEMATRTNRISLFASQRGNVSNTATMPRLLAKLKWLFCGRMETHIECLNVSYESRKGDEFWGLELNVNRLKDLHASFKDLVAVKLESKYRVEGLGVSDAKKKISILRLPPVLHLRLKRFEYNSSRHSVVKITDPYDFPLEIDLSEFVSRSSHYRLHGVVGHSGDLSKGTNYNMIKPTRTSGWYRFDDDRVIPVTVDEVLDTDAYILIYFREDVIEELLSPLSTDDIPKRVREKLEEKQKEKQRKEEEETKQKLFYQVIDLHTFKAHYDDFDLGSPVDTWQITKETSLLALYEEIAHKRNLNIPNFRLWKLTKRQNGTLRPEVPWTPDSSKVVDTIPKEQFQLHLREQKDIYFKFYLEEQKDIWFPTRAITPGPTSGVNEWPNGKTAFIFLKHFDVETQQLHGQRTIYVNIENKAQCLIWIVAEMMGWRADVGIEFHEEVNPRMIDRLELDKTFSQLEIQNGDIICFSRTIPQIRVEELLLQGRFPNAVAFYAHLEKS